MLQSELRKIEARKKERDKKTQDLQKLITAADSQSETRKAERKFPRKKFPQQARPRIDTLVSIEVRYFRIIIYLHLLSNIVCRVIVLNSHLDEITYQLNLLD